jgi:two-component system, chemotaxis family, chemotaxis protein CheY
VSRRKILIVDDEFSARMLLLTLLRPHGECDVAVDGEEALKAVQQAFEANRPYELICLDIMMAGMDGQTCLRHIRSIER